MSKLPPNIPTDMPTPSVGDDPPINHLNSISLTAAPINRNSTSLTAFQMSLQKRNTKLSQLKNSISSSTNLYRDDIYTQESKPPSIITTNNAAANLHNSLLTHNDYVPIQITQDYSNSYHNSLQIESTQKTNVTATTLPCNNSNSKTLECELLYHQDETHYVLNEFCHPVSSTNIDTINECRFGRDCVLYRSKILEQGNQHSELSETTYTPPVNQKRHDKYTYDIMDLRYVSCFRKCTNKGVNNPKKFHHVCYMHNMSKSKDKDMTHLEVSNDDAFTLRLVNLSLNDKNTTEMEDLKAPDGFTQLILPVCGKRCLSNVQKDVNKLMTKMMSSPTVGDGSSKINWDNDGGNGKRSSIEVLIDWITTEENCTFYYGGKLKKGQTCGQRKEGYHYLIADEIRKENGKL
jgi:hypothetical protein